MAAPKTTLQRMARRRTTDLERLANQYKKNVEGLTGQYQTAFSEYERNRAELMRPYEEQVRRYREVDMPAYESAAEAYKQRLEQYNQAIADFEANPTERIQNQRFYGGRGQTIQIDGKMYSLNNFKGPGDVSIKYEAGKPVAYRDRAMPRAPSGAPKAPAAPEAPQVAEFDSRQFDQRRTSLQTDYQREVGERKGARLAAVRRTNRTMLKDA